MSKIDPTARIEDGAVIGEGASIGPYCVIGGNAVIGEGCTLAAHVARHGSHHDRRQLRDFAVCGARRAAAGSSAIVANRRGSKSAHGCTIREGVTMNVGTVKGGGLTRVGDRGFFMNNSHVGHDCTVGNDVIFATSATLGGHCEIGDFVYIGGLSAVHQFTRIGPQVMVGGVCGVRGDVIPFGLVNGQYAEPRRPQHHRHEAPQVHQASGSPPCGRSIKSCFTAPASLPSG